MLLKNGLSFWGYNLNIIQRNHFSDPSAPPRNVCQATVSVFTMESSSFHGLAARALFGKLLCWAVRLWSFFLSFSSAGPPFTFWGQTEPNLIPTCGTLSHIWKMCLLYSSIYMWHDLVPCLSPSLPQFNCLLVMEWPVGRRATSYMVRSDKSKESQTITVLVRGQAVLTTSFFFAWFD